ncbi:restriction endonuclease [Zobellia laminariae]|uniref:nSTAND3 domain-containing NTPase n=1 Tax=Zobellia laminariae TaxID=248906 RepID=UPI0012D9D038|nr:hypothetical protein [Zobellia laminariae]
MIDYDFLVLSPNEFENLSRDLLQKKLGIFIESFTSGPDGGIDLRFATAEKKKNIIQAKRYADYKSLISNLNKEVKKVEKLSPEKYFITTSVGLTPGNKTEIFNLFSPYIKSTEDIYGKDDFNNLIGQYGEIEKQYYKLWLSSTNILEKVLHSKVYNQTAFELEEIKEQIKLYVQNDSFDEALKILKDHKYLIISGIPGIGKTTLARVIVLYLLSKDFDEFVYLNQSIDDGYEMFNDDKKQAFFFDDFLGKNFLENKLLPNEDNKIVKFIEKIKKSHNKALIFTTREYILNQAKSSFEAFSIKNIEIAKCVLDLSSYTNIIKAQILYNHLYFSDVPISHIANLINNKSYLRLVKHRSYNPRIIEAIINRRIWEHCDAEQFSSALLEFFENPDSVWLYAYENTLNKFSQYALLVLLTMGTPALLEDWEEATEEFFKIYNYKYLITFDSIQFNRTIKELENTFIKTQKDSKDKIAVEYQNPSIQDFLVNYLKNKNDLIKSLLQSNIYNNQFLRIFTTKKSDDANNKRKIYLNKSLKEISIDRIIEKYSTLKNSTVITLNRNNEKLSWYKDQRTTYSFLESIIVEYGLENEKLKKFIHTEFQKIIYINNGDYSELRAYVDILATIDLDEFKYNEERIIDVFIENLDFVSHFELLSELETIFPTSYSDTIKGEEFLEKIESVVNREIIKLDDSDVYDFKNNLVDYETMFEVDFQDQIQELNTKENEYQDYLESQAESYIEESRINKHENPERNEDIVIGNIFNSLLEK